MTFEVDVNGRTRTVSIERTAGKYRVILDGTPHEVDAARVGVYGLSLIVDATTDGSRHGAGAELDGSPALDGSPKGLRYGDGAESDASSDRPDAVAQPFRAAMSREVQVTPTGARGELLVTIGGRSIPATVNSRRTGRAAIEGGAGADGEQQVLAPMAGRVVRVLVAAGDDVEVRQGVVVVEAMKMENELRSPKKGRVKAVHVAPGTSVEAGRVLIVVE